MSNSNDKFPPGWYPDGNGNQRWWDGNGWTDHVQPDQSATQPTEQLGATPTQQQAQTVQQAQPEQVSWADSNTNQAAPLAQPLGQKPKMSGGKIAMIIAAIVVGVSLIAALAIVVVRNVVVPSIKTSSLPLVSESSGVAGLPTPTVTPIPSSTPTPFASITPSPSASNSIGARMIERDKFLRDQKFARGTKLLTPQTKQHRAYIKVAKADFKKYRYRWTPVMQSAMLALTMDACETSILNGHNLKTSTARVHVQTEPLIPILTKGMSTKQKNRVTGNLMRTTVKGTGKICPAAYPGWKKVVNKIGNDWDLK